MSEISIKEAIIGGWASRATIYRAIKAGELSVRKTIDGKTYVDAAELVRVFGEPRLKDQGGETNQPEVRHAGDAIETALLKERIDSLDRERNRLERDLTEAKEREAWLRQQLDRQTAVLTHAAASASVGFWRRVFGPKTNTR